jgi:hypothetical protein
VTAGRFPRQPLALAGMLLPFVVAIVLAATLTGGHHPTGNRVVTVTPPTAPGAVVGTKPALPTLTPRRLRNARATARRFLASYLPVVYGRRPARTIVAASHHVKTELSAAAKIPRAPRDRRPRVTKLTTHTQGSATVVAIAIINDSVAKPFQVVFQLSDGHGGWLVTQLANY